MPHNPCIRVLPFRLMVHAPLKWTILKQPESTGLFYLSLFFKVTFLKVGTEISSLFSTTWFSCERRENIDKHIVLGDLPTLFLAALVFHV